MADERLSPPLADVRTGNGYDVHQLEPGDGVTLCGVFIPHDQRLKGHSDADVALHALTDALLATCGAGDIGDHFPPSDPRWKGCDSRHFLRHCRALLAERGWRAGNVDVTVVCERPKVAAHAPAMRANLAQDLGIEVQIAYEVRSIPAIRALVLRGAAASILPRASVADDVLAGRLDARPVVDPVLRRTLYLAWPHKRHPSPSELALRERIRQALRRQTGN